RPDRRLSHGRRRRAVSRSAGRTGEGRRQIPAADGVAGTNARRHSAIGGGAGVSDADVFVRCLTPPGSAAIAVLELRGGGAWRVVRDLFRRGSGGALPDVPKPGLLMPGVIGPPPSDEVVVAVRA